MVVVKSEEVERALAKQIEEYVNKSLLAIMQDPEIGQLLVRPGSHELISILHALELSLTIDASLGVKTYYDPKIQENQMKNAIQKCKEYLKIPLEDVPLHVNDEPPLDKLMQWRLKEAI
jgi:hypothetical protein